MLARLVRELPEEEGFVFEPKRDGFRCLAFRDHDDVDLRSRHDRPLSRYFPEVVQALRRLSYERFVLDGEVVLVRNGVTRLDRGGDAFAAVFEVRQRLPGLGARRLFPRRHDWSTWRTPVASAR